MNGKLTDLRKQVDIIDRGLLKSLAKRAKIVQEIGKLKKSQGQLVLDEERWQQLLDRIFKKAEQVGLSKDFIKKIYHLIHQYSLEIERKV